jgi:protein involved in polysaccharide export with SLBB domain
MKQRATAMATTFALMMLAATVAGCATTSTSGGGGTPLPPRSEVTLRPGDVLRITVWPNPDASGEFTIEDTGYVSLPFLEEVLAAGVPISELRADLRRRYAGAMRNPVVTVTPRYRISVTGEVMRPGIQVITPTDALFDVIGMAGGFRPGADTEKVRVVRAGQVIEYDALRALQTGEGMDAMQLRSGDHVIVPRHRSSILTWNNALTFLQTASMLIITYERLTRTQR